MTKDGVMMTNIHDISNTKTPKSTTNLNKVGEINFKNGMTMTNNNNAISGVKKLNDINVSGKNLSNVGELNGHSIVRPPTQHAFYQTNSMIDATTIGLQAGDTILIGNKKNTPKFTLKLPYSNGLWFYLLNQCQSNTVKVDCEAAAKTGYDLAAPVNFPVVWLCVGNEWHILQGSHGVSSMTFDNGVTVESKGSGVQFVFPGGTGGKGSKVKFNVADFVDFQLADGAYWYYNRSNKYGKKSG